ncbi:MAG TPA: VOC family protein [Candidatus Krumholzibacteria bacterium]|jgi:catechol 2,3-dioxygenase-like lactoylglutathione lyase family enzyme|nr:VOC family protein [Candidatus Krumholzibacteria bacterium]
MTPKPLRLDHLSLYVSDLERAESFYVDILGLERVMRLPDQALLSLGEVNIGLMLGKPPPPEPDVLDRPFGRAHHAFRIEAEAVQAWRQRLSAAAVPTSAVIDWGDHECFYFLDPDGNLLEFVTPPQPDSR